MALIHSLEEEGKILFKYRGQIPVVLFIAAIPVIWFTDYSTISCDIFFAGKIFAIVVSLLGFVFRAYAIGTTPKGTSGRNRDKQVAEQLNKTGIYSTVRHPLYVGNYLMWIGIVMYTLNIWFVLLTTLAYWLYYERIMFTEERFLEREFGDDYINWSKGVPAFIPSLKKYTKSSTSFSLKSVLRREYSGFLATVIGFLFVDVIRDYSMTGEFIYKPLYLYILLVSAAITLLLRSLKHYTKLLSEEDRS
jgi:protein-S-isoprenylcysteine O-methyltransferase Ste14